MAAPFARSPSLFEYLKWAEKQGLQIQHGIISDGRGRPLRQILIRVPDTDRHVILVGVGERERLSALYVASLNRRLGLEEEFPDYALPKARPNSE